MSWANYLFQGLGAKTGLMSCLAPSTDAEIEERIDASVSSYTIESNEDMFKSDMVFESFHHQPRISDKALLAGFLMLWLKRCVMPTPPHEVIVADVAWRVVEHSVCSRRW